MKHEKDDMACIRDNRHDIKLLLFSSCFQHNLVIDFLKDGLGMTSHFMLILI